MTKVTQHTSKLYTTNGPQWKGKRPGSTYRGARMNREKASSKLKAVRLKMGLSREEFDRLVWKTRLLQAKSLRAP
jgi:hypothetical protein